MFRFCNNEEKTELESKSFKELSMEVAFFESGQENMILLYCLPVNAAKNNASFVWNTNEILGFGE
jgi:hypothetical protein